jgi:hypothetical protein
LVESCDFTLSRFRVEDETRQCEFQHIGTGGEVANFYRKK